MTALLTAVEDSPPRSTQVDPGDFAGTAHAFADTQDTFQQIMNTLRSSLGAQSPCIGQDESATYFGGLYKAAGDTVMDGLAALCGLVGNIAQGLARAGTDHSRADAISATDWRADYDTITVNTWDSINAQVVQQITGYEPDWLPGILNQWWPCYDAGKLAGTVQAWHTAQESLTGLQGHLHSALTALVDNNQGSDLDDLNEILGRVHQRP
ncbi:MAG TPA: hypothetical protein VG247_17205 [Pseudonocardiaceae bacterium]|nr:hypothetical protein [Pseudonocardiaceae bacterium]